MGYRTFIGSMPKKEYNKIKSLDTNGLFEFYKESKQLEDVDDFYIGVYKYGKELYEFGKYSDFNPPKKSFKPFFKNQELKNRYEEYDFHIVTKEFLECLIETYKTRVANYYNKIAKPFIRNQEKESEFFNSVKTIYKMPDDGYEFDLTKITAEEQTSIYNVIKHVLDFRTEWCDLTPFNLAGGEEITTSWKFEYAIFELVRIYKSFDWKRNVMIYYGY